MESNQGDLFRNQKKSEGSKMLKMRYIKGVKSMIVNGSNIEFLLDKEKNNK